MAELYRARFEGPAPDVKVKDGTVTVRYSRRTWLLDRRQRTAEVTLSAAIPWRIEFRGGAAEITAELGGLDLIGLEIKGGSSMLHLNLPAPSSVVPIRISGGAARSLSNAPQVCRASPPQRVGARICLRRSTLQQFGQRRADAKQRL